MEPSSLEQYLEHVILAQYAGSIVYPIKWKDHGKVDLDAWAHYFDDANGREHVLLYEDFPGGSYFNDGLSHEVIPAGDETSIHTSVNTAHIVENVIGYFTLYREKS